MKELDLISHFKGFEVNLDDSMMIDMEMLSIVENYGVEALKLPYELIENFTIIKRARDKANGN